MKLLHLDSSSLGDASVSRKLTASVVQAWKQAHSGLEVTYRDLGAAPPAHLTGEVLGALHAADPSQLDARGRAERELTDALIAELLAADVVVIGAPMYNFAIPSTLKAWVDRVAQAGRTFRYTDSGPQGLSGGRTVVIASSRGGVYGDDSALDHQESYLRAVLGFLGITDVRIVRAEGQAMGPEAAQRGVAAAHAQIDEALRLPLAA